MVSDFVDERDGYLALMSEEFASASVTNPALWKEAWCLLEYGECREGYWTSEKFMLQIEEAVKIADIKHPKEGWRVV